MRKVTKIEQTTPVLPKRKRVAAYARVSRETERLQHSLSAQVSYYSELIQKNPEWEYAGVYADNFISGTQADRRAEFQRLIADCEAGKIDIILTKSISRFARNTVDLLETVRKLKDLGIEVRFEKEHISTMSGDGELMLTILASFAQEESRSISENCKWGIRKRFESGEIGTANKRLLGYRYDEERKQYVIVPKEAAIVRRMFSLYLEGKSLQAICDDLNGAGHRTLHGSLFQESSLALLIKNEVYAGDLRRQKSYMADPLKKNKVVNRGELPQYYMADCHEAIIDRETYAKVRAEMERRAALVNPTYCFTKKIRCGVCGNSFTRKTDNIRGHTYVHWICRSKKEKGKNCTSENFSEDELKRISAWVLGLDEFDEETFQTEVEQITVCENGNLEFQMKNGETKVWENLHLHLSRHKPTVTDCFQGKIRCGVCGNLYHRVNGANRWVYWYCIGKKRKGVNCTNVIYADYQLRQIAAHILGLAEFDEAVFEQKIESITVLADGSLAFHFTDGRTETWQKM